MKCTHFAAIMDPATTKGHEKTMIKAVMFDLDGTILSTLDDLAASLNAALAETGRAPKTVDEVCALVGNGVRWMCAHAIGKAETDAETDRLLAAFRAHYAVHMNDTTKPYPGIVHLLAALHRAGIKCAVVSNKYEAAVVDICRRHFGDAFDTAVGEREGIAHKPAPDELIEAMARLGVRPAESVMVGDGAQDILAGKNAHCRTVGVTWGFRTRALLEESGADHIVDTAEALEKLLLENA